MQAGFRWSRLGSRGIVLMYHAVGDECLRRADQKYQVTATGFRAQLDRVAARCTVAALADLWLGRVLSGLRPACLTFDDGRASDYGVVFPELRARGWSGDFFLNAATVGQPGYLNWAQIEEMAAAGMNFQSHAYDHVYLTTLSDSELDRQLAGSKRHLEDALARRVDFLAAPFGDVDSRVVEAALRAGYRAVCTSWSWPARPGGATVSRVAVYGSTTVEELGRLVEGDVLTYSARAVRTAALHLPKRIFLRSRRMDAPASLVQRWR